MKGRDKEVAKIRKANRASAVGRLFLGEIKSWHDFIESDTTNLDSLPRRQLKAGHADVKSRLSREIEKFCKKNFPNMTIDLLSDLFEEIKAHRGIDIPLKDFEEKYAPFHPEVIRDIPSHATVDISLWGLQFKFPEYFLSNDIIQAFLNLKEATKNIKTYGNISHAEAEQNRDEIKRIIRRQEYASRTCILCCFNLIEAYLNGIAWNFAQDSNKMNSLSGNKQKLIRGENPAIFKKKLLEYPEIIAGSKLWTEDQDPVKSFLSDIKPFRDSLVHPSPFSFPQEFGGYDKLKNFYSVDTQLTENTAGLTVGIIQMIHNHITGNNNNNCPKWLQELNDAISNQ
ncbi:MAG: hypothetical protein WD000_07085 [Thermodesulfobacteriota bacterium]